MRNPISSVFNRLLCHLFQRFEQFCVFQVFVGFSIQPPRNARPSLKLLIEGGGGESGKDSVACPQTGWAGERSKPTSWACSPWWRSDGKWWVVCHPATIGHSVSVLSRPRLSSAHTAPSTPTTALCSSKESFPLPPSDVSHLCFRQCGVVSWSR